jgi:molybdate/tungstate transport system substrate-binding protein
VASSGAGPAGSPSGGSGPVNVLYAGSLVTVMEHTIGPAFQSATGYTFTGMSGDSGSLANQIKAKTVQADIFISANPSKDELLQGPANGNWVSWYASFATSGLVLGYDPHSQFAAQLQSKPWYQVITKPGFLLGRTDPSTDPKGKLTVTALDDAASTDAASTKSIESDPANVFPENTLVGRLQAGQLDAGFFYAVEAAAAHIATVPLAGIPDLKAQYTITVLNHAPDQAAADAFVGYLLGSQAGPILTRDGITLVKPAEVTGTPPADLQGILSAP